GHRIESGRLIARDHLRGDDALFHGAVREQRLSRNVADGEDVRHLRAALLIDGDEASFVSAQTGGGEVQRIRDGTAAYRDEYHIEFARFVFSVRGVAVERRLDDLPVFLQF